MGLQYRGENEEINIIFICRLLYWIYIFVSNISLTSLVRLHDPLNELWQNVFFQFLLSPLFMVKTMYIEKTFFSLQGFPNYICVLECTYMFTYAHQFYLAMAISAG
jgi:uncharacterized membrane protein YhaH (DUF805 family)